MLSVLLSALLGGFALGQAAPNFQFLRRRHPEAVLCLLHRRRQAVSRVCLRLRLLHSGPNPAYPLPLPRQAAWVARRHHHLLGVWVDLLPLLLRQVLRWAVAGSRLI